MRVRGSFYGMNLHARDDSSQSPKSLKRAKAKQRLKPISAARFNMDVPVEDALVLEDSHSSSRFVESNAGELTLQQPMRQLPPELMRQGKMLSVYFGQMKVVHNRGSSKKHRKMAHRSPQGRDAVIRRKGLNPDVGLKIDESIREL